MGIGAGAAWMLYYRRDTLLAWPVFRYPGGQAACLILILAYFFGYPKSPAPLGAGLGVVGNWELVFVLPLGFLFAWLIVNTGANPHNIFRLSNGAGQLLGRALDRLGRISYGIYMYQMIAVYFTSFLFSKLTLHEISLPLYFAAYFALAVTGTLFLAHVSYEYMEKRLLRIGRRLAARDTG